MHSLSLPSHSLNITNAYDDGTTTYKSSDTNIATVDAKGDVKGIADGTATITATYTYRNGKTVTATYNVTVKFPVPVINFAKTEIKTDGTATVANTITIKNEYADGKITYKSSDTKIATVDKNGIITAKGDGTTKITVTYTYNNGKKVSKSFTVTVATPTDITELTPNTQHPTPANIYTLDGRYIGKSKETLPSGIYIQNGKKFTK